MTTAAKEMTISKKRKHELPLEVTKMQDDLLKLLLKKSGIQYDTLIDNAKRIFVANNLDLLTESELEKFKPII